jgi:hypothetical protein
MMLYVQNEGTTFDEDIEVDLFIPHNSLMKAVDFPVPLFELEDIIENERVNSWFCPVATADTEEFDYGPVSYSSNSTPPLLPFQQKDYAAEYEQKKRNITTR